MLLEIITSSYGEKYAWIVLSVIRSSFSKWGISNEECKDKRRRTTDGGKHHPM